MSLYQEWEDRANEEREPENYNKFWEDYFLEEKDAYNIILEDKESNITGTVSELAKKYGVSEVTFMGIVDGINTSLEEEIDTEELESDSEITLKIDFEKLYFNMHEAKADWLYNLPQWKDILSEEKRKQISREYRKSKTVRVEKVGRNEPCICGSGKKYKKCCGK